MLGGIMGILGSALFGASDAHAAVDLKGASEALTARGHDGPDHDGGGSIAFDTSHEFAPSDFDLI